jgi:hypothetical protein
VRYLGRRLNESAPRSATPSTSVFLDKPQPITSHNRDCIRDDLSDRSLGNVSNARFTAPRAVVAWGFRFRSSRFHSIFYSRSNTLIVTT